MSEETHDFLGDNLSDSAPAAKAGRGAKAEKKPPEGEQRVRIMLEDNEHIPPCGQFIQVNDRSFLLQPGVEVDVPLCVLDVLDHAVASVPVVDAMNSVVGYRDRLRFPYRVITSRRKAG